MKDYTDITVILDKSGSMESICYSTVEGFNEFLNTQNDVDGKASLTLIQFDHEYIVSYKNVSMHKVNKLDNWTYQPRGTTALNDAIGKTINDIGLRLNDMHESDRPDKVIVVIMTDGHENSSKEFNGIQVKEMIKHQEQKYGWEFMFLGANQDAVEVGISIGCKVGSSATYNSTQTGTIEAFKKMGYNIVKYRGMSDIKRDRIAAGDDTLFTDNDRKELLSN